MVRAMQLMGEFVDILVFSENTCATNACVNRTAHAVRVDIDWTKASVRVVGDPQTVANGTLSIVGTPRYRLFALLGNEKSPQVRSLGSMSVYMNQFPFDRERPTQQLGQVVALSSYDVVVLNSRYTEGWYKKFIAPADAEAKRRGLLTPHHLVVYPPCALMEYSPDKPIDEDRVILTGRFFDDVQGKKHLEAIQVGWAPNSFHRYPAGRVLYHPRPNPRACALLPYPTARHNAILPCRRSVGCSNYPGATRAAS
jgi:hypothetical protein